MNATDTRPPSRLTTLLVSYNTRELLDPCLRALAAAAADIPGHRVVVVDNASRDGSAAHLRAHHPEVRLIESPTNVGFGRANNLALPEFASDYLLLLNTDAFVEPDALAKTMAYMDAHPRCGILGARLVGRDGDLQPSCRYFPTPWNEFLQRTGLKRLFPGTRMVDDMDWDHRSVRQCDWVPGCFYLVRRAVVEAVGLFDPRYFLYFEEVDHCRAAVQAGWQVVYFPDTTVVHIGGESAKSDNAITAAGRQVSALQIESSLLYKRKHGGRSSVLLHLALEAVAALIISLKAVLKRRSGDAWRAPWRQLATVLRLWRATQGGQRPVH